MAKIAVINCNTSVDMTEAIGHAARSGARHGTEITAITPRWGPASVEGFYESYLSAAAVLETLESLDDSWDGIVMAGFGEHGREGARQLLTIPVVDITEASAMAACLVSHRFGVVTTTHAAVGQIADSLMTVGLMGRCTAIRATAIPVLDLLHHDDHAFDTMIETGRQIIDDGADSLILGCAGMAGAEVALSRALGVPVIDAVKAGVALCESLIALRLSTSKIGPYREPKKVITRRLPAATERSAAPV